MKRLLQWTALMAVMFSLTSCGLPTAAGRSVGNLFNGLEKLVPSASASGGMGTR